jgi:hypothetical protein
MDQKITDLFAEVGCTPRFKTSSLKGCYGVSRSAISSRTSRHNRTPLSNT